METKRSGRWIGVLSCGLAALLAAGCGSESDPEDALQADVVAEVPTADEGGTDAPVDAEPAVDDGSPPDAPTVTDPGADPGPADDPGPAQDPGPANDPGPADVGPTDPGPADLGPTDPGGFDPGPVEPIQVNSGATAWYSLIDGQWKVFRFEATAGQVYAISQLDGIAHGYVGTSASVSPAAFDRQTDEKGRLSFVAPATATTFVAVGASGGAASGYFQVADGGTLLDLGANAVELPASAENEFHVFRFPITAGTSYTLQVAGTATTSFGLSVSARAERGQNGEFLYSEWVMSAALPIVEDLAPKPTDAAISGFYYFAVKDGNTAQDPGPRTVTLTITAK